MLGCIALKNFVEDPMKSIEINDGQLIAELETFEKKSTVSNVPTYSAADGHDDFVMATVWCMFSLDMRIIERYYDVQKTVKNKLGEDTPLFVLPMKDSVSNEEEAKRLDEKMTMFKDSYQKEAVSSQAEIEAFIKQNSLDAQSTAIEDPTPIRRPSDIEAFTFQMFK